MTKDALGKPELEKLATKLRELREAGTYPVAAAELFSACGIHGDASSLLRPSASRVIRVSAKQRQSRPQYYATALVFLPEDAKEIVASDVVLLHVIELARTGATNVHGVAALRATLPQALQSTFVESLNRRAESNGTAVPKGVGLLRSKGRPLFFLIERAVLGRDSQPKPPTPPFEVEFRQAFDELDQAAGRRNYVLLHDLRQRLAMIPRPDFDKGLNELRRSQLYSLDSADGRHGRLTPEQVDAGIREAGSVLVYVARR